MAEMTEQSLLKTLRLLQSTKRVAPTHLVVTESGLNYQAERVAAGEISLEQMQAAGVPEDIIGETARRAAIILGFLPNDQ